MAEKLFLFYESCLKNKVKQLNRFLSEDYRVWMNLDEQVKKNLLDNDNEFGTSKIIIYCMNALNYYESKSLQNELNKIYESKIPLVILMLENVSMKKLGGVGLNRIIVKNQSNKNESISHLLAKLYEFRKLNEQLIQQKFSNDMHNVKKHDYQQQLKQRTPVSSSDNYSDNNTNKKRHLKYYYYGNEQRGEQQQQHAYGQRHLYGTYPYIGQTNRLRQETNNKNTRPQIPFTIDNNYYHQYSNSKRHQDHQQQQQQQQHVTSKPAKQKKESSSRTTAISKQPNQLNNMSNNKKELSKSVESIDPYADERPNLQCGPS